MRARRAKRRSADQPSIPPNGTTGCAVELRADSLSPPDISALPELPAFNAMGGGISKGRFIDRRDEKRHFRRFYSFDTTTSCVDDDRTIHRIDVNKLNPNGKSADDRKKLDLALSEFDATVKFLKEGGLSASETGNKVAPQNDHHIVTPKKRIGNRRVVTPNPPKEDVDILPTFSLDGTGTNAALRRCIPEDIFGMEEGRGVLIVCPCGPYNPTRYGLPVTGPHIHARDTTTFAKGGKYMHICGIVSGSNKQGKKYLSDHTDKRELLKGFETRGDALVVQLQGSAYTIEVKYKDIIDCTCEVWDVSINDSSSRDYKNLLSYKADA